MREYWLVTSDGLVNKRCINAVKVEANYTIRRGGRARVALERGLPLIETVGDERVRRIVTPGRYTLGDSSHHCERMLSARNDHSKDTWDVREGGETPPLPRNCMRVCYCSAVKESGGAGST